MHIYESYYQPALQRVLKPFFFASIGFSIPITQMFEGSIVWRGVVYSILMFIAKLACGAWLVRIPGLTLLGLWRGLFVRRKEEHKAAEGAKKEAHEMNEPKGSDADGQGKSGINLEPEADTDTYVVVDGDRLHTPCKHSQDEDQNKDVGNGRDEDGITNLAENDDIKPSNDRKQATKPESRDSPGSSNQQNGFDEPLQRDSAPKLESQDNAAGEDTNAHPHTSSATNPISLYPAFIVGAAMTARGEIGFLISSTAQSNGIFVTSNTSSPSGTAEDESSPIFLVVTWAIMLCTIIGPIIVGTLVGRVKKLERQASKTVGGREKDVLGVWGVE